MIVQFKPVRTGNPLLDHPAVAYMFSRPHQIRDQVVGRPGTSERAKPGSLGNTPSGEMGITLSSDEQAALFPPAPHPQLPFDLWPGNKSAASVPSAAIGTIGPGRSPYGETK